MTEAVRSWVLSVLAASLLLGALEAVAPRGPTRGVARLAAGLVLFWVVVAPLADALPDRLGESLDQALEDASAYSDTLRETDENYLGCIMSQQAAEYIESQAEQLGLEVTATVQCAWTEDGLPVPESAVVQGDLTERARADLSAIIQEDLGIGSEHITFKEAAT